MTARIADRLEAARDELFIGRDDELEQFRDALSGDALSTNVMHVFGPGGVGKTSLLRSYERCCQELDVPVYRIDVRDVEPTPQAFRGVLRKMLTLDDEEPILAALAERDERVVVLVDGYETIEALDDWLRTRFLPDLPERVLFVFAGRNEPAAEWRTDPGWRALVEVLSLRNLDRNAARTLLDRRGVPDSEHEAIIEFTHGHPLALSLVADLLDQRSDSTFDPEDTLDVIDPLLEQFVQEVPGPAHRAVLEASALLPYTTEAALDAILEGPDVRDLFEWLRGLSFVTAREDGLELHDLAREALAADLRWRNPDWHSELHERARHFYIDRLKRGRDRDIPDALSDLTFLLRNHPLIQPFFDRLRSQWSETEGLLEDAYREDDRSDLVAMVEDHEGSASAQWLQYWLGHEAAEIRVYRAEDGTPAGFLLTLELNAVDDTTRADDPMADAAWAYVQAHAPIRAGERATLFRFWMARDTYQSVSPVQSLIFIRQVRHYLSAPNLAFSMLPCRDPETWDSLFGYAGMERLDDAEVEIGSHEYALYGHDWRASPPSRWLDRLAERGFEVTTETSSSSDDQIIVLSRSDFDDALDTAFKNVHRPDQLRDNPLLYSRMVTDAAGRDAGIPARIDALQRIIEEATEELSKDPRDEKYYRAVHCTYIRPAPTQEKAAEQIGVPFSTFRRHLNRGLERISDMLWGDEVGAPT